MFTKMIFHCLVFAFFGLSQNCSAQAVSIDLKIGKQEIVVFGVKSSQIRLVDYKNKTIGYMYTYVNIADTTAAFCTYHTNNKNAYYAVVQELGKAELANLIPDITINKSFKDPEMSTNPANYWTVSVGFRKKDNTIVNAGTTLLLRENGDQTEKETYKGTQYEIPFATKKAATDFVTALKIFLR